MTLPLIIDFVGVAGALLTTLCWLPQMFKTVREKDTRALSLPATSAFTVGILLWLIYGIAIGDWPLIGSNAATLGLMAPILAMKLRYG
jgi:MtN3 and saliva related transmembrane protein